MGKESREAIEFRKARRRSVRAKDLDPQCRLTAGRSPDAKNLDPIGIGSYVDDRRKNNGAPSGSKNVTWEGPTSIMIASAGFHLIESLLKPPSAWR